MTEQVKQAGLKVGDRVKHRYWKDIGTVVKVWDGNTPYGFNEYRVMVKVDDKNPENNCGIGNYRPSDLEVLHG